jgi:uncharacterized SAM-binding protein YcdF (DUF218 family)
MRRRSALGLAAAALLLAAAVAGHSLWLGAIGRFLVRAEAPQTADAVLVLAGDGYGHRILRGAELVRQGFAPRAFVSGPLGFYGSHECDLAIPFAVARGYPESYFVPLANQARSTREEARLTVPELRRRGVRKLLLVTSDYHTRRAGTIFRNLASGMTIVVAASTDNDFDAGRWWTTREGRKCVFFELTKTVAEWFEL